MSTAMTRFCIYVVALAHNNYGRQAKLPEIFREFLTHEAIIFVNVEQHGDLHKILSTFYPGEIINNIKYFEGEHIFEAAWRGWEPH